MNNGIATHKVVSSLERVHTTDTYDDNHVSKNKSHSML
jgi:hypothetical protein